MTTRVVAYIDGFNLYHGLHTMSGRRDLWLDIAALLRTNFLRADQQLVAVNYFSAVVVGSGQNRQDTYLRALTAHTPELAVYLGRYMQRTASCRSCGARWPIYEEKESDVALAVQLVKDAGLGLYDRALIVSADSDMCPAVRAAKTLAPQAQIAAIFPPRRSSMELRNTTDLALQIFDKVPRRHQLPFAVKSPDGGLHTRPDYWR